MQRTLSCYDARRQETEAGLLHNRPAVNKATLRRQETEAGLLHNRLLLIKPRQEAGNRSWVIAQ